MLPPARHSLSEFQIPREGGSPIKTVYSSHVPILELFRTKVLLEGESTNSKYDQITTKSAIPGSTSKPWQWQVNVNNEVSN